MGTAVVTGLQSAQGGVSAEVLLTVAVAVTVTMLALYLFRRSHGIEPVSTASLLSGSTAGTAGFPGIYQTNRGWLGAVAICGGLLALVGLAGIGWFGIATDIHDTPFGLPMVFFGAVLSTGGVLGIVDTFKSRIVLWPDTLEIHELWRVRQLHRSDIESRSRQVAQANGVSTQHLVLLLKDRARRPVKLPLVFKMDARFEEWLRPITDSDAVAAQAFVEEIRNDTRLGTTPEERIARLDQGHKWTKYANYTGPVLLLWGVLHPQPYGLLIGVMALVPWGWIAVMAAMPGVFRVGEGDGRKPGRPDLFAAMLAPSAIFALRALHDIHALDMQLLATWSALIGLALVIGLYCVNRRPARPRSMLVGAVLIAAGYGYGCASFANTLLDRSAVSVHETKVIEKHIDGGRYTRLVLTLEPWGPRELADEVTVSRTLYKKVAAGQTVCVVLHSGALRVRWYEVALCSN